MMLHFMWLVFAHSAHQCLISDSLHQPQVHGRRWLVIESYIRPYCEQIHWVRATKAIHACPHSACPAIA